MDDFMSQETFNKILTIMLFLFFMTVYIVSFVTGKPIDTSGLLTFIVPSLNHVIHQITQSQIVLRKVDSDTQKTVAQTNNNGGSHELQ